MFVILLFFVYYQSYIWNYRGKKYQKQPTFVQKFAIIPIDSCIKKAVKCNPIHCHL